MKDYFGINTHFVDHWEPCSKVPVILSKFLSATLTFYFFYGVLYIFFQTLNCAVAFELFNSFQGARPAFLRQPVVWNKPKNHIFVLFFFVSKIVKKQIPICVWSAQHSHAGQNIQQALRSAKQILRKNAHLTTFICLCI